MAYIRWQTLASGTIVSLFFILGGLLNLAGVDFSDDGDKACTDCYSEIKVKSTYWEIKVTYAGDDKPSVFKKRTRSRTLWVNLDRIEELVTTDPQVKVDILVPTISRYSTMKHKEYGYLRPLKEGDTLIKRNTKSRPSPSRIILHGQKTETQVVKWSFDLEHWLLEDINIDPVWLATSSKYNIVTALGEMKTCQDITREVWDKCINQTIHYYNYTHYGNNKTIPTTELKAETQYFNSTYKCNPIEVLDRIECKTTGFKKCGVKVRDCPNNYRCEIYNKDWCEQSCNMGDCNYNITENKGWGWNYDCVPYANLK